MGQLPPAEQAPSERVSAILDAACRVIAREGAHGLHMKAVATEAGVSKALVHYYFDTRQELLRRAFAHAEHELNRTVEAELATLATGAERLERALLVSVDADSAFGEQRALWNEVWSSLGFDAELRPLVREWYTAWLGRLVALIEEGLADGSIAAGIDARAAAWGLGATTDGIDSLLYLGMIGRDDAAAMVRRAIERELSGPPPGGSGREGRPQGG